MGRNRWTPEQQQAISARAGTLLVSAAAGSGKTSVLVQRVIEYITGDEDPCGIDELLVVTFTKTAAAEMKQRIAGRLTALLEESPYDARLQRQKILLDRARISTIHSFCSDLIRENFYRLNISPGFRIATEDEMVVLCGRAVQEVVEEGYASPSDGFTELVELLSSDKDDNRLMETVVRLYQFIRSTAFPEEWLRRMAAQYDSGPEAPSPWETVLLSYAEERLSHARGCIAASLRLAEQDGDVQAAYGPVLAEDLSALEYCIRSAHEREWDELRKGLGLCAFGRLGTLKKGLGLGIREKIQDWRGEAKELTRGLADYFALPRKEAMEEVLSQKAAVSALTELVARFSQRLDVLKAERNILDFSDLEQLALKLLVEQDGADVRKTELAKSLSVQFREVMIDEFQDTNEAQEYIFQAVSRDGGNLFLVGDVKQSIYRFRQAMPEIFMEKRRQFPLFNPDAPRYPAAVLLGKNFRSREGVTDAVNFIFRQIMSRRMGEIEYNEEEALTAAAFYPPSDTPDVYLKILDMTQAEDVENDEAEAAEIASVISNMIAEQTEITENGVSRPVMYRDFCILLRSAAKHAPAYVRELGKRGIPAWANSQGGFFGTAEVSAMLSLLRAVDNPLQDIPLLAAMMSPVYGFTPDEMAYIRLEAQTGPLYLAVQARAARGDPHCSSFLKDLSFFRQLASTMPVDRLLDMIFAQKHVLPVFRVMRDGALREGNLRLLLEYARTYEGAGYQGLNGFLRYIDRLQEQRSDLAPASAAAETANVVRVVSIHYSKGLEFPVVFLAGCEMKFNRQGHYADLLVHPHAGIGLKRRDPQTAARFCTAAYYAVQLETERDELSEQLRVLYVALTRAKEKLYLLTALEHPARKLASLASQLEGAEPVAPFTVRNGSSFSDWILAAALRHPDGGILRELANEQALPILPALPWNISVEPPKTEETAVCKTETVLPEPTLLPLLEKRLRYRYPWEAYTHIPTKAAASELAEQKTRRQFAAASRPSFALQEGLTAAERGTALHRFMQFADYQMAREDPAAELKRLVRQQFLTEEEGAVIDLGRVSRFFESPLARRIFAACRLHREVRFTMEVPADVFDPAAHGDDAKESVVIQGVADCVLEEPDGLVLVDYKTDRLKREEDFLERYAGQMALYTKAMEACFEKTVKERLLYAFYLERSILVPLQNIEGKSFLSD